LSVGAIVGIAIGAVVLVGVAGFIGYKFCKKRQPETVVYETLNN
jgi:hypothetical protein